MRLALLFTPVCVFCFLFVSVFPCLVLVWFFLWLPEEEFNLAVSSSLWEWRFLYSYERYSFSLWCFKWVGNGALVLGSLNTSSLTHALMAHGCDSIYGPVSYWIWPWLRRICIGFFKQCHMGFPATHWYCYHSQDGLENHFLSVILWLFLLWLRLDLSEFRYEGM